MHDKGYKSNEEWMTLFKKGPNKMVLLFIIYSSIQDLCKKFLCDGWADL